MPDRSKESIQTKRNTLVFQVGGWVDGPAPHHPEKTNMLKKKPRQRLGKKTARGRPKKNWMDDIRKAMNERNLNEGQWEDRKQWSLGVGQRRKTF